MFCTFPFTFIHFQFLRIRTWNHYSSFFWPSLSRRLSYSAVFSPLWLWWWNVSRRTPCVLFKRRVRCWSKFESCSRKPWRTPRKEMYLWLLLERQLLWCSDLWLCCGHMSRDSLCQQIRTRHWRYLENIFIYWWSQHQCMFTWKSNKIYFDK